MARSRKKTPGWCNRQGWAKKQANKVVRQYKGELPRKGNTHRKLFEQYRICDWRNLFFTERKLWELENHPYNSVPRYKAIRK